VSAGELDNRVTFLKRPTIESDAGDDRGKFEDLFSVWAGYAPLSSARRAEYGIAEDVVTGWLKVRESKQINRLSIADRVVFKNNPADNFEIMSIPVKNRSGYRLLRISRQM
jgi:head-tail adaptor